MRKLLVIAASIFLLTAGAAFAQDDDTALDVAPDGDSWIGASSGFPLALTAHYGLGDALGDGVDLRFNGRFDFGDGIGFQLGADALLGIPVDVEDLNVYAGGGPSLGFASTTTVGGVTFSGFRLGAQALGGAEYFVTDENDIGVFAEFRLGFRYVTGYVIPFDIDPTFVAGVNYHF